MVHHTLSTELGVVVLLAVLAASLWIPYIIGVNMHPQAENDAFVRPPALSGFPAWVHRAHRAHLNLLEQLLPFAILVLVVDRLDGYSALTWWAAVIFLGLRVTHAAGMITGTARMPLRPLIFTAGWLCCLAMAAAVFMA
ncbi:MAPEG family protein [Roseobacter ponti]|uniref:MAPEG family protein n=1 Tax=Roseobacter ponti TaxID=1891787 RepID=A0A858SVQ3_9RHOB|nr:MAPEG family protein [Roseobacter ponti]QJF52087.1 MAPEG family protein [Roseobacter ponti]